MRRDSLRRHACAGTACGGMHSGVWQPGWCLLYCGSPGPHPAMLGADALCSHAGRQGLVQPCWMTGPCSAMLDTRASFSPAFRQAVHSAAHLVLVEHCHVLDVAHDASTIKLTHGTSFARPHACKPLCFLWGQGRPEYLARALAVTWAAV
eukprot:364058-Chlamydomonas_euryale.AAC.5